MDPIAKQRKLFRYLDVKKWCLHKRCFYLMQGGQSVCIGAQCSFQESK